MGACGDVHQLFADRWIDCRLHGFSCWHCWQASQREALPDDRKNVNWLTIKAKLFALGATVLTVAAFFLRLKIVTAQRDKARKRADAEAARADQAEDIAEADEKIEAKYSDLQRESKRDIKAKRMPDNIRNRNKRLWYNATRAVKSSATADILSIRRDSVVTNSNTSTRRNQF